MFGTEKGDMSLCLGLKKGTEKGDMSLCLQLLIF